MRRGVNRTFLLGHLASDAEFRHTDGKTPVAEIRVIVNDEYTAAGGETVARSDGFSIKYFGRVAEVLRDHAKKGRLVHVEAELRSERRSDPGTGRMRYSLELIGVEVQLLGPKPQAVEFARERDAAKPAAPAPSAPRQPKARNPF